MKTTTLTLVFLLLSAFAVAAEPPAFEPTSHYDRQEIHGWKVLVHRTLLDKHKELGKKAMELVHADLAQIELVVPDGAVTKLKTVPIWLEYKDRKFPGACFHPSKDWLTENGYNPEKTEAIEISNAANYLDWSRVQPAMVLHELAHAYHYRFLGGYGNEEIVAAYRAAMDAKCYDSVLYYDGDMKRAYAANNPEEYFAELTEAWFKTNDFYPFVRPEVKKHDPKMAELLERLWGR